MFNSIVERWKEGSVKLLEVWFVPDRQIEKNWNEVTSKVTALIQTWSGRSLSLLGRAGNGYMFIASAIYRNSQRIVPEQVRENPLPLCGSVRSHL